MKVERSEGNKKLRTLEQRSEPENRLTWQESSGGRRFEDGQAGRLKVERK